MHNRAARIVEQGRATREAADVMLEDAVERGVAPVPREAYADLEERAAYRIPRDPDDVPTGALTLALGGIEGRCGIRTNDNDFLGCGILIWTTDTLLAALALHEANLEKPSEQPNPPSISQVLAKREQYSPLPYQLAGEVFFLAGAHQGKDICLALRVEDTPGAFGPGDVQGTMLEVVAPKPMPMDGVLLLPQLDGSVITATRQDAPIGAEGD